MPFAIRRPRRRSLAVVAGTVAFATVLGAAPVRAQVVSRDSLPLPADVSERNVGVLRPGDVIEVVVYREEELSNRYLIDARGDVQIPGIGVVPAAGLSPVDVKTRLRDALAQRGFANPELSVQPLIRVYVLGEVRQPGPQLVDPGTSLLQLVTIAGGPSPQADLEETRVIRDGRSYVVDLESALSGSAAGRIVLFSNDYVVVPEESGWTRERIAFYSSFLGAAISLANIIVTLSR